MIGQPLGHYRVVSALGAGGMGEVYRATDTKLGRDVAVKVLPAEVAQDSERLARFEREAKLLAQLNHPNIAHVYGFESATLPSGASAHFLAMELIEGEDLAQRLSRGPIPVDEALAVARQIAEALEEAHEKGIVHRDLKPANVKVTPDGKVKVLDFGLAKAFAGETGATSSADLSRSPTLAHTGTQAGVILGTAAYMSPEQARGKPVDKRSDIWAFGVVLYEMLTGRQLFAGETVSDVIAGVLTREPEWGSLPSAAPPAVRRLLRRCLERDPKLRLRDVGEARVSLRPEGLAEAPAPATGDSRGSRLLRLAPWLLAVGLGLAALLPRETPRDREERPGPVRFSFEARDALRPYVKLSPDGRLVAFNQATGTDSRLFVRPLASLEARPVPTPERTGPFFWSPEAREIAVLLTNRLIAVDVGTGVSRTIAPLPDAPKLGGAWSRGGVILVSVGGTVQRVSATGGSLQTILAPVPDRFSWHAWPAFMPDGQRFLVTSEMRDGAENVPVIQAADLGNPGSAQVVLKRALLVGFADGSLVYGTPEGRLEAVAFDAQRLVVTGDPRVLAEQISYDTRLGIAAASAVDGGVVAHRLGRDPQTEFVWFDRAGRRLGRVSEPGPWHNFDLSADGLRVIAATRRRGSSSNLYLVDTARGITSPALESEDTASDPTWSPDGSRIAYRMRGSLVARPIQGGEEKVLVREQAYPDSWSRDGKWLAYGAPRVGHYDLFAVAVDEPTRPPLLLATGSPQADEPRFSPNGRWLAYHASASGGGDQVSVIPFPPTGERWQISGAGGVQPRWSPDGEELFYLDRAGRVMSVALPGSDPRRAGVPRPLFETGIEASNAFDQFAVAPGGRFLLRLPFGNDPGVPVHVILGWNRQQREP